MRKFDLSLRSSRSSYFATFRHQLTILSKTDALDEEKWLNMLGTFVKDWFRYEDRKSGSAGMPRPISYAVFCLKKKKGTEGRRPGPARPRRTGRTWTRRAVAAAPRAGHWPPGHRRRSSANL